MTAEKSFAMIFQVRRDDKKNGDTNGNDTPNINVPH